MRDFWTDHAFLRFLVVAVVLAIAVVSCPVQAQVPVAAQGYQRLYTRIANAAWGLNPPVASLAAQIHQESEWRCTAISKVGARGCAQMMPATANWLAGKYPSLARGLVNDPAWAFEAQVRYMRFLYDRTSGANYCERLAFGQQAYNSGEAWVRRRKALSPHPEICFNATCDINPGVKPSNQVEAQEYPVRIRSLAHRYVSWGRTACVSV